MIGLESEPGALDAATRASLYRLLARFLSAPAGAEDLKLAGALTGDESAVGQAVQTFANFAAVAEPAVAADDFQRLFIGLGGGELMPYASHYVSGSLHDRPLVDLRQDMRRIGVRQRDGVSEPEDHAATILEVMADLVDGRIDTGVISTGEFFDKHISPWMGSFFRDLAGVDGAPFYSALGRVGVEFIAGEPRLLAGGDGAQPSRSSGDAA